jgi:hypothetical protein
LEQWTENGFVRQPYVWSAIQLYNGKKSPTEQVTVDEFIPIRGPWSDEFVFEHLGKELERGRKPIPGLLDVQLELLDCFPLSTIDPSMRPYQASKDTDTPSAGLIKEVEWFGNKLHPFLSYVNNLYVQPEVVSLRHSHAAVRVRIQLLEDDVEPSLIRPLEVIFARWDGRIQLSEDYTAVCLKDKRSAFSEEIKMQLPGVLTEKHHLLFTIVAYPSGQALGYAYSPIFSSTHGAIKDALRTLTVFPELKAGYLSEEVRPVKISETRKPYICFRTTLVSSIYPESSALFSLSHVFSPDGSINESSKPEQILQAVHRLPSSICVTFFPPILNLLFRILSGGGSSALNSQTVLCIMAVITK